jgi:hypothetical protein
MKTLVRAVFTRPIRDRPYGAELVRTERFVMPKRRPTRMAQTRRMGMQYRRAQLPEAPRFSPYRYGSRANVGAPQCLILAVKGVPKAIFSEYSQRDLGRSRKEGVDLVV